MEKEHAKNHFPYLYTFLTFYVIALFLVGASLCDFSEVIAGLRQIVLTEDSLITDYVRVAGPGPALVNSSLVTAIAVILLYGSHESHNGLTLVVVGLMSGFSLFGKNFINIWPILFGTWLYAKSRKEHFGKYAAIGLMSTALSPIISYIFLDNGWGNPVLALVVGITIGFIMPSLSAYTYRIQNGMNLYNVGFACGLVAFIFVPLMSSMGATPATRYDWAMDCGHIFFPVLLVFCLFLIVAGLALNPLPIWANWAGYRLLLKTSGRAPTDYLRMFGTGPVLINTGINGLIGMAFILLGGGTLNGPTVGGILTIMGFSSYGKHAGNIIPVMGGVFLGSIIMDWSLSDPSVQLACLFCTTLAPVSGYFGWPYGVIAGFLHSSVVLYTGSPVAGMNLYNNGFSGGLIATVLYPVILAIARHRKPVIENLDYFSEMEQDTPIMAPEPHEMLETETDIDPADPIGPPVEPPKVKISYYKPKEKHQKHRHFFE